MSLSDLSSMASVISGGAVLVSLVYLSLQTRQNTRHTMALIQQGRIAALREIFIATADAEIATAMIVATGGTATPREVQQQQFSAISGARLFGWQDTYSQYQSGLLDEDFLSQMRVGAEQALREPAFRAVWERYRVQGTRFAAFMDGLTASLSAPKS